MLVTGFGISHVGHDVAPLDDVCAGAHLLRKA
jgi:hypothetical protein